MKDITLSNLWAILEELMGTQLLWAAAAVVGVLLLLFVIAVSRRHGFRGTPASIGIRAGLVVGIAIMVIAPFLTQATFHNFSGSVDWLALMVAGLLSFVGTVVAVYGVMGLGSRA